MRAAVFVLASLLAGFVVGYVVSSRDEERHRPETDDAARHWREGAQYGEAKGYADGWTSGRIALVAEQDAKRHHPTGSPLSALKALDAEADRRMKGGE